MYKIRYLMDGRLIRGLLTQPPQDQANIVIARRSLVLKTCWNTAE